MIFLKKILTLIVLLQLGACATGNGIQIASNSLANVVQRCSVHHQVNTNFTIVDASNLDYYIVVSGSDFSSREPKNYCHISKNQTILLYANGKQPHFKNAKGSTEYKNQYEDIANGNVLLGELKIVRYKFIAGQWRYIETKLVSS